MVRPQSNKALPTGDSGGPSPFDSIRRTDVYGREYWTSRDMQPLMGYPRWQHFEPVIERAKKAARNVSDAAAVFTEVRENPSEQGGRPLRDVHLSRAAAYYVAMNGDPDKPEVALAQAYFVRRTREAELGALTELEVRRTALARAREMVDYRLFRDMMAENAPDYVPSSKSTQIFFGAMQNKLYRHITGMTAKEIVKARPISTWKGCEDGKHPTKKDREIAKNYLSCTELEKLDRMVARLCLRAEDIADDKVHLRLDQWSDLVDIEIATATRPHMLPAA